MNDPEPKRPGPDATREEWLSAAEEHAAWRTRQAEASRGAAIANVMLLDLNQPLRRFLTDEELERTLELLMQLLQTLRDEGHGGAQTYVAATLQAALMDEAAERHNQLEHARIMVEADGHEVSISHDVVAERQDGRGWRALCYCDVDLPWRSTRDVAVADVEQHLASVGGGAWSAITD